jgi:hypothetical protein
MVHCHPRAKRRVQHVFFFQMLLFHIITLSVGDETCNSQNSGHPLFWQVEMSKRLRPAFAVTEAAVATARSRRRLPAVEKSGKYHANVWFICAVALTPTRCFDFAKAPLLRATATRAGNMTISDNPNHSVPQAGTYYLLWGVGKARLW